MSIFDSISWFPVFGFQRLIFPLLQAEELNRFREEDAGKHFGYPFCFTEYSLADQFGDGRGFVWAWPDFLDSNAITDEQCRSDYVAPVVSMQAHSAPLGITFFNWRPEVLLDCGDSQQFPQWMDGYAFIAYHGSWVSASWAFFCVVELASLSF